MIKCEEKTVSRNTADDITHHNIQSENIQKYRIDHNDGDSRLSCQDSAMDSLESSPGIIKTEGNSHQDCDEGLGNDSPASSNKTNSPHPVASVSPHPVAISPNPITSISPDPQVHAPPSDNIKQHASQTKNVYIPPLGLNDVFLHPTYADIKRVPANLPQIEQTLPAYPVDHIQPSLGINAAFYSFRMYSPDTQYTVTSQSQDATYIVTSQSPEPSYIVASQYSDYNTSQHPSQLQYPPSRSVQSHFQMDQSQYINNNIAPSQYSIQNNQSHYPTVQSDKSRDSKSIQQHDLPRQSHDLLVTSIKSPVSTETHIPNSTLDSESARDFDSQEVASSLSEWSNYNNKDSPTHKRHKPREKQILSHPKDIQYRRKRFKNTKQALENSGLLGVTMKTSELMKENRSLSDDVKKLQQATIEFLKEVLNSPANAHIKEFILRQMKERTTNRQTLNTSASKC